jgi:CspA family cold shock protein
MQKGKVKWFHKKKGYGFIILETGEEAFVHFSSISGDGFKFLEDGEEVAFDVEKDAKGIKAKNVTRQQVVQRTR